MPGATPALALAAALAAAVPAFAQDARPETDPIGRVPDARARFNAENPGAGDRVFGGNQADQGEYPFQVALLATESLDQSPESQANGQFCGGSLIAPEWVLTAAHCVVFDGQLIEPRQVTILTGATALTEGTRNQVIEIIANEGYDPTTVDNDIALIRLAKPADAPTISIVREAGADAGKAIVTGWGRMEDGTFPISLMEAEIELQPNAACNTGIKEVRARDLAMILQDVSRRMRFSDQGINDGVAVLAGTMTDPLTDNMLCAGLPSGARDACQGDSGGPLFVAGAGGPTQVGVVSWGEGPFDAEAPCGAKNAFGVYTRISQYTAWIDEKMATPAPKTGGGSGAGTGTLTRP